MRIGPLRIACSAALLVALGRSSSAAAQGYAAPPPSAAPSSPAPAEPPPPPSSAPAPEQAPPPGAAPAPAAPPVATPQSATTQGQWAYTQQYGWVWMTYGEQSTYVPPDGQGEPLEYVYSPSLGWNWVVAPWVWGVGPWPYFGARGPGALAWYHHGWWRTPSRWRFRAAPAHGEMASRGVRPAPARGSRQARSVERQEPSRRGHDERGEGGEPREGGRRGEGGHHGEGERR